jgi:hypothetical protein
VEKKEVAVEASGWGSVEEGVLKVGLIMNLKGV